MRQEIAELEFRRLRLFGDDFKVHTVAHLFTKTVRSTSHRSSGLPPSQIRCPIVCRAKAEADAVATHLSDTRRNLPTNHTPTRCWCWMLATRTFLSSMIETRPENFAGPTQRIRVLCCISCESPQLTIQRNDARINWQHSQANIVAALGGVHVQVERRLEG